MTITGQIGWTFPRHDVLPKTGPWVDEPDKLQWVDERTDLDCLMLRNHFGAWCGYVGVSEGHPAYGMHYSEDGDDYQNPVLAGISVHGGLTFSNFCHEGMGNDAVCHVPLPGRPTEVWWLGFDTAHCGDVMPISIRQPIAFEYGDTYRDQEYVEAQTVSLARQLAAIAN